MAAELVLGNACRIADAVGAMFGRDCEVAVHDLRVPTRSLVHLVNGHVTGRKLGSPIRDLIVRVIPSLAEGEEVLAGYETVLDNGARIKSSTVILRDDNGEPVAALCINYSTARIALALETLSDLIAVPEQESPSGSAASTQHLSDASNFLKTIVENVVAPYAGRARPMSKAERLDVVEFLHAKGAFHIKGSIALVAERLGVSSPTVYRYIEQALARQDGRTVPASEKLEPGSTKRQASKRRGHSHG